jgi:uncharacterized membrane protein
MAFKFVSAVVIAFALSGCGGGEGAPGAPSPSPNATPGGQAEALIETAYVAHGNEPFWSVETLANRVVYSSPEKLDGESLDAVVSQAGGWARFDAKMEGAPLVLEVRKAACTDDMSGFAFSHEARLTRGDGTWNGCARLASEPQPRE